jgi:signal transduction histidine kinase/ligand-binding sensor domain-containing protein
MLRLHLNHGIVGIPMHPPSSHPIEIPTYLTAVRLLSYFSALLVLSLSTTTASAQYRFDHWTADNGLPQNSVRDIIQTRDGYLWLATLDGLVRFDGVRFTVFNKSNSPGIIINRFLQLYEDGQGDLWALTENTGVTRLQHGRFTTFTTAQGLPDNNINAMGGDGQGNLMMFVGPRLFRWFEGQFQPADDLRLTGTPLPSDRTQHIPMAMAKFKLACFADGQLHRWATGAEQIRFCSPAQDRAGRLWFESNIGLLRYENGRAVRINQQPDGLPDTQARLVYGHSQSLQTFSRKKDGSLWLTDLDSMQSKLVSQKLPEGFDLFMAYADREGNYWFGSWRNGLYRARRQDVTAYTKAQGLMVREVYPVLEDHAGTIWIGSIEDGLFRFQNGVFSQHPDSAFVSLYITSLFEDRAGQVWVNGQQRFVDGRMVHGDTNEVLPPEMGNCWTMYEDQEGALWFGTDLGVMRYKDGQRTRFTTKDGLAGNNTKVIIGDNAGSIWLGSYGGLTHFREGRFTAWTEADGLPGNNVRALKHDSDGTLWIGTYDSGLGRFKDGRFTRYAMKEGLFDNGVFQILEDDFGWVWMSCNRGIYRVRKQELNDFAEGEIRTVTSVAFGKSDGMENVECNGGRWPAGIKARDGKLWFPTMGGVVMIDPATITTNANPPPIVLEDLKIDNRSVPLETWEAAIRDPQSAIRIMPEQESFEIEYTALSFINSVNLRFKYRLEGLDHDWVEAGTRRTAYFPHVPPGDYTFTVIAANSDGVWNKEGKSVRITVLPPFYRTWWFLTLVTLVIGGAVFVAFKSRVMQIERRQAVQQAFARQLLESQEAERKRIAAELHDSLGQNLLVIKNRALLNAMTTPDEQARTQFTEFSDAVAQTLEEVRTISYDLRPSHLDQLGLRTALVAMIEKVSASSTIQFTHAIDKSDDLLRPGDEITLYRIAQECLNNILKHSGATKVMLNLAVYAGELTLTIRDNGRGFMPDEEMHRRAGLGLQGIAERVRILGGTHAIESAHGQGTTVTLRIALKDRQR